MRTLTIIGAPSGAGKSTLANQMIARGEAATAIDFKKLIWPIPDRAIVELSTNKWHRVLRSPNYARLVLYLDTCSHINLIHLRVPSSTELARRYWGRLIKDRDGLQMLKPRAWLHCLEYLVTNKLAEAENTWAHFAEAISYIHSDKVITISEHVEGNSRACEASEKEARQPASA